MVWSLHSPPPWQLSSHQKRDVAYTPYLHDACHLNSGLNTTCSNKDFQSLNWNFQNNHENIFRTRFYEMYFYKIKTIGFHSVTVSF